MRSIVSKTSDKKYQTGEQTL